jgi:hypothetical protein
VNAGKGCSKVFFASACQSRSFFSPNSANRVSKVGTNDLGCILVLPSQVGEHHMLFDENVDKDLATINEELRS